MKGDENVKEKLKGRILDLEKLALSREDAMEYYAKKADKRKIKFNEKLVVKEIKEGSLVLRYDNRFDYKLLVVELDSPLFSFFCIVFHCCFPIQS